MSVEKIVLKQYQAIIDKAHKQVKSLSMPPQGWLRTARNALSMSGAQLARLMGVTRGHISKTEIAEQTNSVTIKNMQQIAAAMNCQFVYAIVPKDGTVQSILELRALQKATVIVKKTNTHMALEEQKLSKKQFEFEINRLSDEMLKDKLSVLWDD